MAEGPGIAAAAGAGTCVARPVYLNSSGRHLFGWLTTAAAAPPVGVGLLICSPFGYEAICAHRSMRTFAETVAALGVPVLRFDYAGTGDSDDIDPAADQIELWTDDVVAATLELRRLTGVSRIAVLGLRLGAMLAALAMERGAAVESLLAFAPVVSGPRYVKEMRRSLLLAGENAPGTPAGAATAAAPAAAKAAPGGLEISGFGLSGATLETLSHLDLATRQPAESCRIHIIDRSDLPAASAWHAMLCSRQVTSSYEKASGFVEMMMTPPYDAVTPAAVTQRICAWIRDLASSPGSSSPCGSAFGAAQSGSQRCEAALTVPGGAPSPASKTLMERAVFVSTDPVIFGIVTALVGNERRRRAVILLNDGATKHVGASRLNVLLARRWALRGYYVLRFDLAGLGDSATRPGAKDDEVFPPDALADIASAIEFVRRDHGAREVTLVGLCSGAYHSLRAAVAALPVNRVLMINPENFFWDEGMTRQSLLEAEVVRNPGIYLERIRSPRYWSRVLSGQVNLWRIIRILYGRIWLTIEGALRDAARRLGIRPSRDLGWELEEIAARGIRIVFVFARGEPGIELLRIQGGATLKRLGDRCRVHVLDEADHVFSRSGPRAALEEILSEELLTRSVCPTPEPAHRT